MKIDQKYHFKQLDGFRFLAITSVMIAHFGSSPVVDKIPFGYGVNFFFVLSSFLITRILLLAKQENEQNGVGNLFSLRQFYIRRFLRIFPIYYLTVAFFFVVNLAPCRQIIFSLLTYTTNFKIANGSNAGSFTHLWSLAVEEQFYICFPFLILFIDTRYLLKLLILFTVIGFFGRTGLYLHNPNFIPYSQFDTISCLDSLGLGGLLAYLCIYKGQFLNKLVGNGPAFYGSVLTFLVTMLFSNSMFAVIFMKLFFNIMSFFILGRAVTTGYRGIVKRILENPAISYLGRISYGMYLFHLFVPGCLRLILNHFGLHAAFLDNSSFLVVNALLFALITVGIASASWFLIEKPINNLKKYFEYNSDRTNRVPKIEIIKN